MYENTRDYEGSCAPHFPPNVKWLSFEDPEHSASEWRSAKARAAAERFRPLADCFLLCMPPPRECGSGKQNGKGGPKSAKVVVNLPCACQVEVAQVGH